MTEPGVRSGATGGSAEGRPQRGDTGGLWSRTRRALHGKWVVRGLTVLVAAGVLLAVLHATVLSPAAYQVRILFPDASNVVEGAPVQVRGAPSGTVSDMYVKDGKAVVVATLKSFYAPLHTGTTAYIAYRAILGERLVELSPGPKSNPVIPSGSFIAGQNRVGLDQILNSLNPTVRAKLVKLVPQLDALMSGREGQVRATLATAAPTVSALGAVLSGIGADSVTLRQLVTDVNALVTRAVGKQQAIDQTISGLTSALQSVAAHQSQLGSAVGELPATVSQAASTLGQVPTAAAKVDPLLVQLQPSVAQLPTVAGELRPVLQGLVPVTAELMPVLSGLQQVLQVAPPLLSGAQAVAPGLAQAVGALEPALSFLRPYTPELVGWLENWGNAAAGYDSNGNYARIWVNAGPGNANVLPATVPPVNVVDPYRPPGALAGQPWTDAAGSPVS